MNIIGTVTQLTGKVVAINSDGTERILALGDAIFEDEFIRVSPDATIEISMENSSELVVLEGGQNWLASQETYVQADELDLSEAVADVNSIQEAILAGIDPTDVAEATAAGGEPGAGGEGNEGSSTVNIDRTADEVDPTAGYDTVGFADGNDEESAEALPFSPPPTVSVDLDLSDDGTTNSLTGGTTNTVALSVTITGSDGSNLGTFETVPAEDGSWSVDVSAVDFDEEILYTATAVATNPIGEEAEAQDSDQFDLIPTVTVDLEIGDDGTGNSLLGGSEHATGVVVTLTGSDGSDLGTFTPVLAEDGSWSVDVSGVSFEEEIVYTATAVASDNVGNTAEAQDSDIYDLLPTVTVDLEIGDDGTGNTLIGGTENATDLTVTLTGSDGSDLGTFTPTLAEDGSWSIDVSGVNFEEEVIYTAVAVASDNAGNEAQADDSDGYDFIPTVTVDLDIGADGTGNTLDGGSTNATAVTVTLSGSDGTDLGSFTPTLAADGSWSIDVSGINFEEEVVYTAVAVASDNAGNTAGAFDSDFYDLLPPPTVSVDLQVGSDGESNSLTGGSSLATSVTVTLTGSDGSNLGTFSPPLAGDGSWSVDVSGLNFDEEVTYTAVAVASNSAGQAQAQDTDGFDLLPTVTVDLVVGEEVSSLTGGSSNATSVSVIITGDDQSSYGPFEPTLNPDGSWSVDVSNIPFAEDVVYTATATASDTAGNEANATDVDGFDLTPTVSVTLDIDESDGVGGTLSGGSTGAVTVDVTLSNAGGVVATWTNVAVDGSGNWSVDVSGINFDQDSIYTATAEAKDGDGDLSGPQTSTDSYDLNPTVSVTLDIDESDGIGGTLSGGSTGAVTVDVSLSNAGGVVATWTNVAVDGSGNWSVDVSGIDFDEDVVYTATAEAKDGDGDLSGPETSTDSYDFSPTVSVTLDIDESDGIGGTLSGGSTGAVTVDVTLSNAGGVVATWTNVAVDGSGNWSVDVSGIDFDEDVVYTATAEAKDGDGDLSGPETSTDSYDFTPTVSVTLDIDDSDGIGGTLSGGSSGAVTVDVTLSNAGGVVATWTNVAVDGSGNWSVDVSGIDFDEDVVYTATAEAKDGDGDLSGPETSTDSYDFTPTVSVTLDIDESDGIGGTLSGGSTGAVTVDVTLSNAGGVVATWTNVAVDGSGNWSVDVSGIDFDEDVVYTATAEAKDGDGDLSGPETSTDSYDFTPTVSVTLDIDESDGVGGTLSGGSTGAVTVDVTLSNAGGVVATWTNVAVDGSGNWSVDVSGIDFDEDVVYTATAEAKDGDGDLSGPETSTDSYDFTPTVSVTLDIDESDGIGGTLSGGSSGAVTVDVTLSNAGGVVATWTNVAVDGSGNWSVDVSGIDFDEDVVYTATAEAKDGDGDLSGPETSTDSYDFTPTVSVTLDIDESDGIGGTLSGGSTGAVTVDVTLSNAGGVVATWTNVAVDGSGNWSVDVSGIDFDEDVVYTATAEAKDGDGDLSGPETSTDSYDFTPTVSVTLDIDESDGIGGTLSGGSTGAVTVDVTLSNAGGVVATWTNIAVDGSGNWSVDVSGINFDEDVVYTATAEAKDGDGDLSGPQTSTDSYDFTPTVSVTLDIDESDGIGGTLSGGSTGAVTVDVTLSNAGGVVATWTNVAVDGSGNWSVDVSGIDFDEDVVYTATAEAKDGDGDLSGPETSTDSYDFTPTVSVTLDIDESDGIGGTLSGGSTGAVTVDVTLSNAGGVVATWTNVAVDGSGNWSVDVSGIDFDEDVVYTATAEAKDGDGDLSGPETSTDSYDFTPTVSVTLDIDESDGIGGTLSGGSTDAVTVDVTLSNAGGVVATWTNVAVDGSGNWSVDVSGIDFDEDVVYTATAEAKDGDGDLSGPETSTDSYDFTPTVSVTLDIDESDGIGGTLSGGSTGAVTVDVTLSNAGGVVATWTNVAVDGSGNWSVDVSGIDFDEDVVYTATAEAKDGDGDLSGPETSTDSYDFTPTVSVTLDIDDSDGIGGTLSGGSTGAVTVDVTLSNAGGVVATWTNVAVDGSGNWSVDVSGIDFDEDVVYTATAEAKDGDGDLSGPETSTDSYDFTPTVSVTLDIDESDGIGGTLSGGSTGAVTVDVTLSNAGGVVATWTNVAVDGSGNWSVDVSGIDFDEDVVYTATAEAKDGDGDLSGPETSTDSYDFTPTVSVNLDIDESDGIGGTLGGGSTNATSISVTVTDSNGTEVFSGTATPAGDGSWSVDVSGVTFDSGELYTATAVASDGDGDQATAQDTDSYVGPPITYEGDSGWLMNLSHPGTDVKMAFKLKTSGGNKATLAEGRTIHWDVKISDHTVNVGLLTAASLIPGTSVAFEELYSANGDSYFRIYMTADSSDVVLDNNDQFEVFYPDGGTLDDSDFLIVNSDVYVRPHNNFNEDYNTSLETSNTDTAADDTTWLSSDGDGGELAAGGTSPDAGGVFNFLTGDDVIFGTASDDTITGGADDDFIEGRSGDDILSGGAGNDILFGDVGTDILSGGADNDVLSGGQGSDSLTGGTGNDTFKWSIGDQGQAASPAVDTVEDFNANTVGETDVLDLRDLLEGESLGTIDSYLSVSETADGVLIGASYDGTGSESQQILLEGKTLSDLGANAADTQIQILTDLINNGHIDVDS